MELVTGSTLTQFGIVGTNYCGPGYANGKLGEKADPFGDTTGLVDLACRTHDVGYDNAENSATPAADRAVADAELISNANMGQTTIFSNSEYGPKRISVKFTENRGLSHSSYRILKYAHQFKTVEGGPPI